MNTSNHAGHAFHTALAIPGQLQHLPEYKDPNTAAVCGFLFGGIGLGLYFKNWQDLVLPVVLWLCCAIFAPVTIGTSILAAGCFCAVYGYRRAKASNEKLAMRQSIAIQRQDNPNVPPVIPPGYVMPQIAYPNPPPHEGLRAIEVSAKTTSVTAGSANVAGKRTLVSLLREVEEAFQAGVIDEVERRTSRQQILSGISQSQQAA